MKSDVPAREPCDESAVSSRGSIEHQAIGGTVCAPLSTGHV
jgi:hypothetical protein